jgi:two-component system, OmpR family, sensor histidine kinase ArlS
LKIRNKITLIFTALVTAILLVLNMTVYYLTSVETADNFRKRLRNRASNNAQIFDFFGDTSVNMLYRIDAGALAVLPQKSVVIYDTLGRLLYEYNVENAHRLQFDSAELQDVKLSTEKLFKIKDRQGLAVYYSGQNRSFIIAVAAFDQDGKQGIAELKKVLIVSLLVGTLVTLITGFIFSSQLVKPIKDIITNVNDISSQNLSKRLPAGISQDELNQLAMTFNGLLNRLQDSFTTQRHFISNASHELSTPLTSISSQLQVTLQKERSSGEYQQVLQSIQEDVEQMRQLTKSLLEIAKTGTQGSIELNDLRVDELLLKVISDVKRINQSYEVEMQFLDTPEDEKQCMVFGNFDLLYSAFKNIIENGCKYSPNKASVVKVSFKERNILIEVINQGDIITEQEIEQIFQPFFRGGNPADNKGFGLGLPLARRILGLHKGNITVNSVRQGTSFVISLPSLLHNDIQF